jgi:polyisoprenyl-teichoic acid--peptidoglycan teichoic acid transferase
MDGFVRQPPLKGIPRQRYREHSAPVVRAPVAPRPPVVQPPNPFRPYAQLPVEHANPKTKHGRHKKQHAKWSWKKRLTVTGLAILVLGFGVGTWVGTTLLGKVDKVFHGNVFSDAQALFSTATLKGESQGRVNILLAGDSVDDPNHAGADLTDSIMLISIDTTNHTGFMLSIPRDTWVNIPGMGYEKINAANTVTGFSAAGYPNGGMGQLEQVVSTDFGIPIDYYGLIDYTAFRDAVNAVGTINIDIQSPDPRGLYDPNTNLKLPNGEVTLDGQQALDLARARGDGYGSYGFPDNDYDRTQHQRQMLVALEQKAGTVGVLTNPLKVTQLVDAIGNNVQTDLSLQDVLRLVQLTKGINLNSMKSLALTDSGTGALLQNYTAPDGEEALIPSDGIGDYSQIQQYYEQLTSGSSVSTVASETPSVMILNASDVVGLAKKEEAVLEAKGFNVVGVADANNEYPDSMIVDLSNGQKPTAKQVLQQTFTTDTTTTTSTSSSLEAGEANNYTADFVVVLGKNWDSTSP